MSAIRGEKVVFRKKDIVSLDHLPSSQVEDPIIVHCPPPRSRVGHATRICGLFAGIILLLGAALIATIESGVFDAPLSARAQIALNSAIGPRYKAEVGSAVIRFSSDFRLALEARQVNLIDQESGRHLSTTEAVRMALDPLALLRGHVALAAIEAQDIALDTALLPSGDPVKLADLRVDSTPAAMETAFSYLDMLDNFVERGNTSSVRISGLELKFARKDTAPLSIVIDNLALARAGPQSLRLRGEIAINGAVAMLDVVAQQSAGRTASLTASLRNADLTPFLLKRNDLGEIRQGVNSFADLTVSAVRQGEGVEPKLDASVDLKPGLLYVDGDEQQLSRATLNADYNFTQQTLEITKSDAQLAATSIPFTGGIIDLDRLDPAAGKGFGVDLLISGGKAAPTGSGEAPVDFDAQATGRFLTGSNELQMNNITVSTPLGALFGSLHMRFADVSPEISFVGQSQRMQTAAIKQLWPFWMAPRARTWVLGNLFGGTVTNASISVFIPEGRLDEAVGKGLRLDEKQLNISFDIADTRMNVAGDIPPLRDTAAHFDLAGPVATVNLHSGTAYFASGRSVTLGASEFVIPSTYDKPLMADLKLAISGSADAIAELLTYKPVQVLQRTGFEPPDLAGQIDATVTAHFGLVTAQNPPPAEWKANMRLADVALAKAMSGHRISKLDGTLDADPSRVRLDAKGQIDGLAADIDMVEPAGPSSDVARQRVITLTLNNSQRDTIMPGLSDIIDGTIKVELTRLDEERQGVKVDLKQATLSVPWVGWSKGSGIPANAEFEASGPSDSMSIQNFQLKGDGFGASGDLSISNGGLASADFSNIRLSASDDFALSVKRGKSAYDISVTGATADMRPIIGRLKGKDGDGKDDGTAVSIRAKLNTITGFNNERIGNFEATYVSRAGRLQTLDFSGVTSSGQAVVSQTGGGESNPIISITSGDAGAVARFVDLYRHMDGGLLNLRARLRAGGDWDGSIDIRQFALVNEQRLHSIVSTPVGADQRSLNSAVRRDIDTSAQQFQRAFARIVSQNGIVGVENGVARGDQVGATFQGIIRDENGNMNMTGTFMPAYGLNRLFAELPLIGIILGNGTDRGLIGITFRLTGNFDSPNLLINPLSVIAPGVFRQIFEFQ